MNVVDANRVCSESLLVTADGYEQRRTELETLRTDRRRELSERLREAREDGNPSDNPALLDLLEEQIQLERRIAILQEQVSAAQVVPPAADGIAGIGSSVRVRDVTVGEVAEYELVGAIESDLANGKVSVGAPVGRAIFGRRAGEIVHVDTPRGTRQFEILRVRPIGGRPAGSN